ncbi:MAG TPA: hypothetical protein VIG49_01420 [Acetobacteraceae bacterium]
MTYLVDVPPEALPPVRRRDLDHAWHAAREAALRQHWGVVRGFRFNRPDGTHTDLALADRDARCWVSGVDGCFGLGTRHGLSVCLRLLALVDLLARAPWTHPLFHLARDGAELHPALLRAAAVETLGADARFEEAGFRARLNRITAGPRLASPTTPRPTGAPV